MIAEHEKIGNIGKLEIKVVAIFLIVIALIIVVSSIFQENIIAYAKTLVDIALGKDEDSLVVEDSNLENAIMCVYYRCKEGCNSNKIRNLEIETASGKKNCKEDFCDPFEYDGKVCGKVALEQRVEVLLPETTKLKKFGIFEYFELSGSCSPSTNIWWLATTVNIDDTSGSTCYDKQEILTVSMPHMIWYAKCDVKPGTYHLHTEYTQFEWKVVICP
jgi:hypothetical protein